MDEPGGLIFDLDGTLVDTARVGRAALNATIAAFGIRPCAAALLAVEPGRCLVHEDSFIGLEAARAAGMSAVDVRKTLPS